MHDYITTYFTPDNHCSHGDPLGCDAIVLGSLLKSSTAIGIWPRPEDPFGGITFKGLASQVRDMEVRDDCRQGNYYGNGSHGVKDIIKAMVRSLGDQLCGLKLDAFLPGAQSKNKKKKKGKKKSIVSVRIPKFFLC